MIHCKAITFPCTFSYDYQNARAEAWQCGLRDVCRARDGACKYKACPLRACRTAFGDTAAETLLFVLRKALGTWNVPHLS